MQANAIVSSSGPYGSFAWVPVFPSVEGILRVGFG
jgi:hypothetical protein